MDREQAYKKIKELVERFDEQIASYKSGNYNETQTRREFIDPFFKALGWDIDNEAGSAEAYKEVIHEDKVKVESTTKAPDYSFRLPGGKRLFFVEAKKPSVSVKEEIDPAYQVRRYGWSAKLPISLITDFEEFSVYDCSKKPKPDDKASVARIKYLTYKEYLQEFDFIWGTFSKEKVLKGSFDKYVQNNKNKRGTATVDKEFLQSLDGWRTLLAENIAKQNNEINEDELNFVVQQTIDRIIFLRIAEDRGVEFYGRLKAIVEGKSDFYKSLFDYYKEADQKYNSGLFDFTQDLLSKNIQIDNKTIKTIINQLYYPESPYEFSVLSVEILGSAYEQFLGKQIKINSRHKAVIEEKPEVRKAGGVYYTPEYIVEYIVKNTLGKLVHNKKPAEIAKIKICDPACGSGSFLIGAYQFLLDWHKDYYLAKQKEAKQDKALTPDGNLATSLKKQILLNSIYGVDIDLNAVEVTKLSLLLKCMEGETEASISQQMKFFNQRVLPTLDGNIKCGNSLIDLDFYDEQFDFGEEKKIKPFSWRNTFLEVFKNGGFDVIIGNPPYDVLEKDRLEETIPHDALQKYIRKNSTYDDAKGGKLNLYRFFIVKAINLLSKGGKVGLIVPLSLIGDKSCKKTREFLLESTNYLEMDCFPQKDIPSKILFEDAKLSTVILTAEKDNQLGSSKKSFIVRTYPYNSFEDQHRFCQISLIDLRTIDSNNLSIPLISEKSWRVLRKIHSMNFIRIIGALEEDFIVTRGEINQTTYKNYIVEDFNHNERLIKGVQIGKFRINKKLSQGKIEFFDEKKFLKDGRNSKNVVNKSRIAIQRITGVDEKLRIVSTIIHPKAYFADSTNSFQLSETTNYNIHYVLGLLNSQLYQWRFKLTSSNNNVSTNELLSMPFRLIDFSDNKDIQIHNKIASLVNQIITLNEEKQQTKLGSQLDQIQSQINYLEDKVNRLVYELYSLTDEEIAVVEGFL
jgi:Alw26I/Eco31I/Esp3I family type II restriction m6 adenine DNA methyltransferase